MGCSLYRVSICLLCVATCCLRVIRSSTEVWRIWFLDVSFSVVLMSASMVFFQLCDSKGLVKKVLYKGGVGFLKLVDFQILFILCLIESSKACGVSCEGYRRSLLNLKINGS